VFAEHLTILSYMTKSKRLFWTRGVREQLNEELKKYGL